MVFLPDRRILVTERPGRLRVVGTTESSHLLSTGLPAVDARNQGGLLDVTLDPNFATNRLIYWSYAEPRGQGANNTAVARGRFVDGATPRVENVQVIFHQVPVARIEPPLRRPAGVRPRRHAVRHAWASARSPRDACRRSGWTACSGKIVRINADGSIPKDNPFVGKEGVRPEIWSIGHRNVQAATLHPTTGELWEVEHGTRGGDELNIVRKGRDYGWPTIAYGIEYAGRPITGGITQKAGMEQPLYYWDPVIAPSGMTFYTGDLVPGVERQSLHRRACRARTWCGWTSSGEKVTGEERLLGQVNERIRDVTQGPDGALYLLTDNPKGRVLKVVPKK